MQKLDIAKYKRVVIFTAHPDDLEGFMGGTVKLMSPTAEIFSIIFSEGDRGRWEGKYRRLPKQEFEDVRVAEAETAKLLLDLDYVQTLDFDDRQIPVSKSIVKLVEAYVKKLQPDLVISFEYLPHTNLYPHPDHLAVAKDVNAAMHAITFPRIDYLVATTIHPTHYVAIGRVYSVKRKALNCHKSQLRLNRVLFFVLDELPTRLWGVLNGVRHAESFRLVNLS